MKRFWLVLLSLGLVMAFSVSAFAVDVKFSGSYYAAGMYLDKTKLTKGDGQRRYKHSLLLSEIAPPDGLCRFSGPEAGHPLRCDGKIVGRLEIFRAFIYFTGYVLGRNQGGK